MWGAFAGSLAGSDRSLWVCSSFPLPHPSIVQKQMVVLTLGLPMTHLKQRQSCCPSTGSLMGQGKGEGRAGGCPPDAQVPIVESSPSRPQMHTSCLERGCLLASARIGHKADFHTSWSPRFLGPSFPFSLRSLQDRECVLPGEMFPLGMEPRAPPKGLEEAKSRSPPPSRALPSPSRPHPGTQAGLSGLGCPKIRS